MVCRRVCDNDHDCKKEEERLTTPTGDMTGQGEGTTTTTMTRKTAMTTTMQDRPQERSNEKIKNDIVGLHRQID